MLGPLAVKYAQLEEGQPLVFLLSTHNHTDNPPAVDSRFRGAEYSPRNPYFFQWWNYLVVDAETLDHWTLGFQLNVGNESVSRGFMGFTHMRGPKYLRRSGASVPLRDVSTNPSNFDVKYKIGELVPYQQIVIDDDTYRIVGDLTNGLVSFDLTFHRVHGVIVGIDQNKEQIESCVMTSSLWGYHSEVEGTIREGNKVFTITRTPRYRAYAAGSWGCRILPWSWFWLIDPSETPKDDVSMAWGHADITIPGLGDVAGVFSVTAYLNKLISSRSARLWPGTSVSPLLMASSSDHYVRDFTLQRLDWTEYSDEFGTATVPLRQIFGIATKHFNISVDFKVKLEDYFRIAVITLVNDQEVVFSDFRAVAVPAHIRILKDGALVYEKTVSTMTAVEYAYAPPVDGQRFREAMGSSGDNSMVDLEFQ
jgi:hypothetical protein